LANLAILQDLLDTTETAKRIHAGIGRVLEDAQHTVVGQVAPYQLAVPHTAVGSFGELQAFFGEPMGHAVRTAGVLKILKHQPNRPLDFLVRVQHNLLFLPAQTHR